MLHLLRVGDKVKVWPRPGVDVPLAAPTAVETPAGVQILPSRNIAAEGEKVVWSEWLHEMAKIGALLFSDPRHENDGGPKGAGGIRHALHVRHPHEVVGKGKDGKPLSALEAGAESEHELAHWQALKHEGAKLSDAAVKRIAEEGTQAEADAKKAEADAKKAEAAKAAQQAQGDGHPSDPIK